MRHISKTKSLLKVLLVALVLVGAPAYAVTYAVQTLQHSGLYCLLEPGLSSGYTASILPDGLTLTPSGPGHSATFFCPATFVSTYTNPWITNVWFSADARTPAANSPVTTNCTGALITNAGSFTGLNDLSAPDTNSYYGIEAAFFMCTINGVEARVNAYKVQVSYYSAPPPPP